MTRLPFALTLSLLASPALAGPPLDQPAPAPAATSGTATVYDCQIAGRTERFVIADGTLAEGPGTLSVLTEGVYAVTRDGVTYLIDPTGVQIDQGIDAGKWPCVESAAAPAPAVPDAGQMARIVELEAELANLQAALSAANGERDAAIAARQAALAARDEAQASSAAASLAAQTALNDSAALQAQVETAETAAATAIAAQTAAEARSAELEALAAVRAADLVELQALLDEMNATLASTEARVAELEAAANADAAEIAQLRTLQAQTAEERATAEARVVELELSLAAAMAALEEDVAEGDAAEDMFEDQSATEDEEFDADAALLAIEDSDLSPISRAALAAAVEQARNNPGLVAEVVTRLQNALGE